jgi:hypothetical protein
MTTPNLSDIGTQAIQDLILNITNAKEFVLEQAPDIARQFVAYKIATNSVSVIFALICIGIVTVIIFKLKNIKLVDDDNAIFKYAGIFLLVCFYPLLGSWLIDAGDSLLLSTLAPKVMLLKELIHIVK